MLKNLILIVAIFVAILLALTFGEAVFHDIFAWISTLTGVLIRNFSDLFAVVGNYPDLGPERWPDPREEPLSEGASR